MLTVESVTQVVGLQGFRVMALTHFFSVGMRDGYTIIMYAYI